MELPYQKMFYMALSTKFRLDFKGYCIMGALNNYNYYNNKEKESNNDKKEDK